jgi:hypothetical protein
MNCDQVRELLSLFHDAELDRAGRCAVEVHLGECPSCAAELGALAELSEMARNLPDLEPPAELWGRVAGQLQAEQARLCGPGIFRVRRVAAVAALVAAAFAAGWMAHRPTVEGPSTVRVEHQPVGVDIDLDRLVAADSMREMPADEAARRVGFHVVTAQKLPDGYCLEGCCLCRDGCCDLMRCRYGRGSDKILVLQGEPDHPIDYGDGPALEARVHGKSARIVQRDGRLAASWQAKRSTVGIVGPRDLSELVRLIAYVDERLEGATP